MDESTPVPATLTERLERVWRQAALAGTPMPGEPTLATALTASRPAVREALVRLEERGWIRRRQGADTTVNRAVLDIPARIDEQVDQSELIASMGRVPRLELVAQELSEVTAEESENFSVTPGTTVLRTTKRWFADEVPVMVARDSIPLRVPGLPAVIDCTAPVFALTSELGNEVVDWEIVWPGARTLSRADATLFATRAGTAVMTLDLIGVDRRGDTAYWASELHAADAFRYALVRSIRH